MKKLFLTVLFISLFSGCAMNHDNEVDRETALQVAIEHIKERWDYDSIPRDWVPVVNDKGDAWEVGFDLPKDVVGGTPVVQVRKADGKVTKSFHYQ